MRFYTEQTRIYSSQSLCISKSVWLENNEFSGVIVITAKFYWKYMLYLEILLETPFLYRVIYYWKTLRDYNDNEKYNNLNI